VTLREEVTGLLQELLRVNTVNPPGNESAAAELLRDYLARSGIPCELVGRSPERLNLVARLPGGDGPSLALLAHTDTVRADAEEWARDPWSGDLVDGQIWGRGALDMKNQVAASAVAFASLWRDGLRPAGDVILALTADEEVNDGYGLSWLVQAHPDLVRADYSLNEGAGERCVFGGKVFYLCAVGEKMSAPFRVHVRGRSGHASMPGIADNALVKAAALIERLAAFEPKRQLLPETEAFFEVAGPLETLDPTIAAMLEATLSLTISPTIIDASHKRNVIPAVCEVECDCRLLPGQTQAEAEAEIRGWLGDGDYELEWIESVGGSRSSQHTPLWDALSGWIAAEEPGAAVAPVVLPGFTDSHYLRQAFGTVAYGFFPMRAMAPELAARLIHSADERIPVDDLELGTRFVYDLARTLGTWTSPSA
jgi:acetylornithine deacetylase/succinyl-diaminopimelate desuccinylase-like protein